MRERETGTSQDTHSGRPRSAVVAVGAARQRTPGDLRREGEARDRLHAAVDALGARTPTDADLYELLALAREAFPPVTAAGRLIAAIVRHDALGAVLAREEEESG